MTRAISRDRPYSPARYFTTVRWVHDSVVAELMSENQGGLKEGSSGSPAKSEASPASTPHNTPQSSASMMTLLALGPPVSTLSGSDRTLAALQLGRRAALESRRYVVNCLVHAKPQKVLSHQADDTLPWAIQRLETFDQYCDDECTKEAREADIRKLESLQHKPRGGSNISALEVDPQSPSGQVANLYYQLTEATENGKVVAKVPEWARKMIRNKVTVDSVELAAFELMCLCMMEKPSESGSSGSEDSESDSDEVGTIPKAIEDRIWFLLERKCGQLSSRQGQLWERVHLASLAACAIALCVRCFLSNSSGASEGDTREVISPVIAKPPPERVLLYGGRAVVAEDEMVEVARVADGAVVRESVRRRILEEPYEHLLLLEDLEYALHGDKVPSEGQPDQLSVAAAKAAAAAASPQNLPGWPGIADDGDEGKLLSPANLSIESEGKYCDFILVHGASALVSENTIKEVLEELPPVQEATLGYFLQGLGIIPDEPLDESMLQSLIDEAESDGSVGEVEKLGQDFKMTLSESYRACGVCGSDCEGSSFKCVDCGVCLHEACRTLLGWNNRNTDLTDATIGVVFAFLPCASCIMAPLTGYLLQLLGYFTVLLAGGVFVAIGTLGFGFSKVLWSFLAFRAIQGVGAACTYSATSAIMARLFPGDIEKIFAFQELIGNVGFAVGPTIGAGLFQVGGFHTSFIVLTAIHFGVMVLMLATWVPIPPAASLPTSDGAAQSGRKVVGVSEVLRMRHILITVLCSALVSSAFGFMDPVLSEHFLAVLGDVSPSTMGLLFAFPSVTMAIATVLIPKTTSLLTKHVTLALGLLVMGASFLTLGPTLKVTSNPWVQQLIALGLAGIGSSWGWVPCMPYMIEGIPPEMGHGAIDMVSALFNGGASLGEALGPILGGSLTGHVSTRPSTALYGL
ncbi:hypothetical protein Pmar_PMAR019002 [Perkinsus marinus ATCC 50983]|uniref:Major facilitator superfamily (MFS) profile domain-containing protein n=1 Tax=Perkinsus marinus (strain ATCC 50983 / TXsc) TaxID=423536 RepID=C5KY17_PERM5|nr:hypothetical protein Pmar_PMAR019002 [Perkinsus marinus ATCC 50983]EER10624.1 hypothetical protein Pmar_PMAR019002 [Perkinsus marinus ATCC 50983]|eukprot:XP_002778829.1 hypothetical protein Pmar_PMAR019002 [Perkinsus marinus ATCC 50983]